MMAHAHSNQRLYNQTELPEDFHEIGIVSGYRHPASSFRECLGSLLKLHNETFNVWTHLVSFMCYVFYSVKISQELNLFDEDNLPFLLLLITSCIFPLGSACAHLFNNMSSVARHVCFMIDYACIAMYAFGASISNEAYAIPPSWRRNFFGYYFLLGMFICCVGTIASACRTRFMPTNAQTKILRLSSFVMVYLIGMSSVIYRLLFCSERNECHLIRDYSLSFYLMVISALFYGSHLPERLLPGRFDVYFHSHQIFHVTVILATYFYTRGVLMDMKNFERGEYVRVSNDNIVKLLIAFAFICLFCVVYFGKKMQRLKNSLIVQSTGHRNKEN